MMQMVKNNLLIIIILLAIVIGVFIMRDSSSPDVYSEADERSELISPDVTDGIDELIEGDGEKVVVDIKGEVKSPGVYEFNDGDRMQDVINQAGGLLKTADDKQVNLAQKLQDEMIIIVPKAGEEAEQINQMSPDGQQKVKVNNATKEQLETLPGIGPSKAQAIINYRDEFGLFKTAEDLLNIPGIGEKTLENMIDAVEVP